MGTLSRAGEAGPGRASRPSAAHRAPAGSEVVLAVDGGGSKTDVVAIALDGSLVGHARGPGSNPQTRGWELAGPILDDVRGRVVSALDGARIRTTHVYLAGLDLPDELTAATAALRHWDVDGGAPDVLDNDLFALLRAGTLSPDAAAVVCGTGHQRARGPSGRRDRAVPGDRRRVRRLGWRRVPRQPGALARGPRGRRARTGDGTRVRRARCPRPRDGPRGHRGHPLRPPGPAGLQPALPRAVRGRGRRGRRRRRGSSRGRRRRSSCWRRSRSDDSASGRRRRAPCPSSSAAACSRRGTRCSSTRSSAASRARVPGAEPTWVTAPPVLGAGLAALESVGARPEALERYRAAVLSREFTSTAALIA